MCLVHCVGFLLLKVGQLISDRLSNKHQLYSERASFTRGQPEDFLVSNLAADEQWIADLHLKLQVDHLQQHDTTCSVVGPDTVVSVLEIAGSHRSISAPCLRCQEVIHYMFCLHGVHSTGPPSAADSTS